MPVHIFKSVSTPSKHDMTSILGLIQAFERGEYYYMKRRSQLFVIGLPGGDAPPASP